jgi:hypothetical protein
MADIAVFEFLYGADAHRNVQREAIGGCGCTMPILVIAGSAGT